MPTSTDSSPDPSSSVGPAAPAAGDHLDISPAAWQGVSAQLKTGQIKLDGDVAVKLGQALQTAIGRVLLVQQESGQATTVNTFSGLNSGELLAKKLSQVGADFGSVTLGSHLNILYAMSDAFNSAIKMYNKAESSSATSLNILSMPSSADIDKTDSSAMLDHGLNQLDGFSLVHVTNPDGSVTDVTLQYPDIYTFPGARGFTNPTDPTFAQSRSSMKLEPYYRTPNYGWNALTDTWDGLESDNTTWSTQLGPAKNILGQGMPWVYHDNPWGPELQTVNDFYWKLYEMVDPDTVDRAGTAWNAMAAELDIAFNDLTTQIYQLKNSWTGQGADTAFKRTSDYADSTQTLTNTMRTIGSLLSDPTHGLAQSLRTTRSIMPNAPIPPDIPGLNFPNSSDPGDDPREKYRTGMQVTYMPAISYTDAHIPVFPDPATAPSSSSNPPTTGSLADLLGMLGSLPNYSAGKFNVLDSPPNLPGSAIPSGPSTGSRTYLPNRGNGSAEDLASLKREQAALNKASEDQKAQSAAEDLRMKQADDQQLAAMALADKKQQDAIAQQQQASEAEQRRAQAQSELQQASNQAFGIMQQIGQQLASAAQQAIPRPSTPAFPDPTSVPDQPASPEDSRAMPVGGGPRTGPGISAPYAPLVNDPSLADKLFPRAALASPDPTATGRAQPPNPFSTTGMPGSPGMMSPAASGAGANQSQDRKRSKSLQSQNHLLEAFGTSPRVTRPVLGTELTADAEPANGATSEGAVHSPGAQRFLGGDLQPASRRSVGAPQQAQLNPLTFDE
ncbi:hypothetical protein [Nocardia sp. CDC160]|uniref:hypothetical protein n=1 Tax=Nocardia sp. CDC160 TaxID=3112166 RepID=UPI002DBE8251|nr:hypothetical protein [Nocardia sp. CDC160]MEC3920340.1 hypothetical protein [Nocardia sp. CDC160]